MKNKNTNSEFLASYYEVDGLFFSTVSDNDFLVRCFLPSSSYDNLLVNIRDFSLVDDDFFSRKAADIYFGVPVDLDDVPINLDALNISSFQRNVLRETTRIPYGEVRTYGEIASGIGSSAFRAVGTALSRNPLPLFIPCHRVVRSDGRIGEFYGGCDMKRFILECEGLEITGDKIL